jgi:hypothetical protein
MQPAAHTSAASHASHISISTGLSREVDELASCSRYSEFRVEVCCSLDCQHQMQVVLFMKGHAAGIRCAISKLVPGHGCMLAGNSPQPQHAQHGCCWRRCMLHNTCFSRAQARW